MSEENNNKQNLTNNSEPKSGIKQPDNDNTILKADELLSVKEKELIKANTELITLQKNMAKSLASKYSINSDIDMKKLKFDSLEELESSLINYCENNKIFYKKLNNDSDDIKQSLMAKPSKKVFLF